MGAREVAPLYGRLLRLHAPLLAVVAGGAFVFEVFMVWVSAQLDTGLGLRTLLEQLLPPDARAVVFEQLGVATFEGAVAFGFQHPIFLVAVLGFAVVAGTVPAAERETGFLDLVLARPVPRWTYLAGVLLLVVTGAVVLPLAILAGAAVGLATVDGVPPGLHWTAYIPAAVALAALLLAVGGVALLAGAGARRRGPAVGKVVALLLALYWLHLVGPLWDLLATARWLSPFSYFDPAGVAAAGLSVRDLAVLAGVSLAAVGCAFVEFRRQDL